ncbi:hypothetical protein KSP40_PGU012030 [Platanthera guangdongensis]|uniref:Uncharacterized protein n=1 Tax=Platanthera guangdongensis TaxID=2320717 RepID=A0ABR2LRU6_9ASPA
MPSIHSSPFSPPPKKPRIPQHPEFYPNVQLPTSPFSQTLFIPSSSPACCLRNDTPAVGLQGPRHCHYGTDIPELHFGMVQAGPNLHTGFHRLDHLAHSPRISTGLIVQNLGVHEDVSCTLTIGNPSLNALHNKEWNAKSLNVKKNCNKVCIATTPRFVLFGKPIFTEHELSHCANIPSNKYYDKMTNLLDGSGSLIHQNGMGDISSSGGLS